MYKKRAEASQPRPAAGKTELPSGRAHGLIMLITSANLLPRRRGNRLRIGRLQASGGTNGAEADVGPGDIAAGKFC
jgi:hypothetical protein